MIHSTASTTDSPNPAVVATPNDSFRNLACFVASQSTPIEGQNASGNPATTMRVLTIMMASN